MKALRELRGETLVKAADSLAERARKRKEESQERAADVMEGLLRIASVRLQEAAGELHRAFNGQEVAISARVSPDEDDKQDWWSWQIIEAARKHNYFAELNRPRRWVALRLRLPEIEKEETRLVISIHAVGRAADLYAVTAFLTNPQASGEGFESNRWENNVISDHAFRFGAGTTKVEDLETPFREWLKTIIENGLSTWGEHL